MKVTPSSEGETSSAWRGSPVIGFWWLSWTIRRSWPIFRTGKGLRSQSRVTEAAMDRTLIVDARGGAGDEDSENRFGILSLAEAGCS